MCWPIWWCAKVGWTARWIQKRLSYEIHRKFYPKSWSATVATKHQRNMCHTNVAVATRPTDCVVPNVCKNKRELVSLLLWLLPGDTITCTRVDVLCREVWMWDLSIDRNRALSPVRNCRNLWWSNTNRLYCQKCAVALLLSERNHNAPTEQMRRIEISFTNGYHNDNSKYSHQYWLTDRVDDSRVTTLHRRHAVRVSCHWSHSSLAMHGISPHTLPHVGPAQNWCSPDKLVQHL